jgi:outer membrane protein, multidrug efflux system
MNNCLKRLLHANALFRGVAAASGPVTDPQGPFLGDLRAPAPRPAHFKKTQGDSRMTASIAIRSRRTGLIASLLVLGACATPLPPKDKLAPSAADTVIPAMQGAQTATLKPLSIDRWWTLLGDSALDQLMEEALARNTDLESAVARVREAQANLDATGAARLPTLDLQLQGGRQRQSTVGAMAIPPGMNPQASSHKAQLGAGYEVDLWGRIASGTAAARQQLLATEWARAGVEWSLTARVAEAYFGVAATDRQIEISVAVRDGRAAIVKMRQEEFRAGAGNEFDVRRAEAELTGTEATLASLVKHRASYERTLALLLGRTPAEVATGKVQRARMDETRPLDVVLPRTEAASLLVQRPDIRQSEAQLDAANYSVDAARAATLPSLRLSGAVGSDARSMSDLFSGPAFIWSIAASATQPLIDGGRLKAQARAEEARADQALASYRQTVAAAVGELREAYEVLDVAQLSLRAQHDRVTALGRARDLARLGFDNGAYSYLDLLDAERNLYQAQLDQVGAYRDRLVGQVFAYRALGGGYAAPQAQRIASQKP